MAGNLGRRDQLLALQWISDNVARFGGSRRDVTLFGTDSGAASVGLHLLHPPSWPHFSRAVLQSGSPLSDWALAASADAALNNSRELSALAGCSQSDAAALVTCMRALSERALLRAQCQWLQRGDDGLDKGGHRFLPVVDGDFVRDRPEKLLEAGRVKRGPILIGGCCTIRTW